MNNNRDSYPNSGILFVNDRKNGDRDPDSKGSGTVICNHCGAVTELWLSAWRKVSTRTGTKFLSLSFRPKDDVQARTRPEPAPQDDDIL